MELVLDVVVSGLEVWMGLVLAELRGLGLEELWGLGFEELWGSGLVV